VDSTIYGRESKPEQAGDCRSKHRRGRSALMEPKRRWTHLLAGQKTSTGKINREDTEVEEPHRAVVARKPG
jgi:hypothetical protein